MVALIVVMSIFGIVKLLEVGAVIATMGAGATGTMTLGIAAPPAGGGGGEAGLAEIVTARKAAVSSGAGVAGKIVRLHTT